MKEKIDKQIINGEPQKIKPNYIQLECCCDCDLVHLEYYEIIDGIIWRTSYRDDWETDRDRKRNKVVVYNRSKK